MNMNVQIKNPGSETITGAFGLSDEDMSNFVDAVMSNDGESMSEAIMLEGSNEKFGQIVTAMTCMYITRIVKEQLKSERLSELITSLVKIMEEIE